MNLLLMGCNCSVMFLGHYLFVPVSLCGTTGIITYLGEKKGLKHMNILNKVSLFPVLDLQPYVPYLLV
jgi:hypothetical protein